MNKIDQEKLMRDTMRVKKCSEGDNYRVINQTYIFRQLLPLLKKKMFKETSNNRFGEKRSNEKVQKLLDKASNQLTGFQKSIKDIYSLFNNTNELLQINKQLISIEEKWKITRDSFLQQDTKFKTNTQKITLSNFYNKIIPIFSIEFKDKKFAEKILKLEYYEYEKELCTYKEREDTTIRKRSLVITEIQEFLTDPELLDNIYSDIPSLKLSSKEAKEKLQELFNKNKETSPIGKAYDSFTGKVGNKSNQKLI